MFYMVSVTWGLICTGTYLGITNIYGSWELQKVTGLSKGGKDWWQPANHCICFVEGQNSQMVWEVEPENKEQLQLGLAQFLLSWWWVLANRPVARAEMYQKFSVQCKRGGKRRDNTVQVQDSQLEQTVWILPLRDGEALSKSLGLSEFLIPHL